MLKLHLPGKFSKCNPHNVANFSFISFKAVILNLFISYVFPVNVRLVPGPMRGRVEVKYNNIWGTVCDDNFDTVDGKVICKMLGYQAALATFKAPPGNFFIGLAIFFSSEKSRQGKKCSKPAQGTKG